MNKTNCFVHNKQTLSKFHSFINEIYRSKQFHPRIIFKLSKRCCNCQQTNQSPIDFDYLIKLCQQIEQEQTIPIVKHKKEIHHLILNYPSSLTSRQRTYKIGRFVGKKGEHIKNLETKLNISLNILNSKSSKQLSKQFTNLKLKCNNSICFCILIQLKNENNSIETIKQTLQTQWNNIDVSLKLPTTKNKQRHTIPQLEKDSRWQPKQSKQKIKSKIKRSQNQQHLTIVPDQPSRPFFKQFQ